MRETWQRYRWLLGSLAFLINVGCQTTADFDNGKVYLRGKGIAKYHIYNS